MDEAGGNAHGSYFRKVLEDSQRCALELLERNNELRALVVRLQVQEQHLQGQVDALQAAGEQVRQLKGRLLEAERENQTLREELAQARSAIEQHAREQERLHLMLTRVGQDDRRYGEELAQLQQQANSLANLYVASYSLHSTLDRSRLIEATKEIVANLIGSEEMAFFAVDGRRGRLRLLDAAGLDPERYRELPLDGGLIARAVRGGRPLVVGPGDRPADGEEGLTAVVPLRVEEKVVAAIAIFRLLPQKSGLADLDRELIDLLASQAGMALHCADLHARLEAAEAGS